MSADFSYEEFEKLDGVALGLYVVNTCKEGRVPADFVDYFRANVNSWNGVRLEYALLPLLKVNSPAARHLVSDYLNHPLPYIRFVAFKMVDDMETIDAYVLSRIDEFVQTPEWQELFLPQEMKRFRDHAGKKLVS